MPKQRSPEESEAGSRFQARSRVADKSYDKSARPAAVVASGLKKSFDGNIAVDGVDLRVELEETVALLGPNGAGKTTTILMLLDVTRPDEGHVELCGYPLPRQREAALSRTGFAAGYLGLPDRLKVRESLNVFADMYGIEDPRARVDEVLDLFGVAHLAPRFSGTLSSGQRTLVGLAKALLPRPELLILDEPTASLDPDVALRTRRVLIELRDTEGFSLLLTSHNMDEVEMLADRVVFISRGKVVANAPPEELADAFGMDDLEGVFLEIADQARDQ